ncbi:hypothetical protein BRETT_004653 [Brettanomyces bruxellensis]|uniref:RNA helicase n=1 Tax=Dekkera bruxellensis TaxID=5007 RepID=A0A871R760_DEKBR|nr:uncharacterized protein BRETT_004653 [Brettanomyces bruxellensis]QOU20005.1 hypothetical protein BRETT_004653 [Brettanomyces bruxellensis]
MSGYKYNEIANKVLRTDKHLLDEDALQERNRKINTLPQSVVGEISVKDMGTRVSSSDKRLNREEIEKEINNYENKEHGKGENDDKSGRHRLEKRARVNHNVLNSNIEQYNYYPSTDNNRETLSRILSWCSNQLNNDLPDDVVRSLGDVIIQIMKSDALEAKEKLSKINAALQHSISDEDFQNILELCASITDYHAKDSGNLSGEGESGSVSDEESEFSDSDDASSSGESESSSSESLQNASDVEKEKGGFLRPHDLRNEDIVILDGDKMAEKQKVDIKSVDQLWLAREFAKLFPTSDSYKHSEMAKQVRNWLHSLFEQKMDVIKFRQLLLGLFNYENNDWINMFLSNRVTIYYGLRLSEIAPSDGDKKQKLFEEMDKAGFKSLVLEYDDSLKRASEDKDEDVRSLKKQKLSDEDKEKPKNAKLPKYVDLNNLIFDQGSHLLTANEFKLPNGSFRRLKKSWEEVHIPPPKSAISTFKGRLVLIKDLPEWAQQAFPSNETKSLNVIQSKVYPTAFLDDANILMCAPTGAGKTNVAMLTVLRLLSKHMDKNLHLRLNDFKIVYIAPLKALVQEQVREFRRRLQYLGITVNELTGDSNLTKHQIASTQILVTTPEKWDVITRKNNDASYIKFVKLIIIDEIHLLHDARGPVIENIVARTLRSSDDENKVRLVGLSATLPNYEDVAEFLHVEERNGLFYFDQSYRPCPLAQQFIGITEKKSLKKYQALNDACYEKVIESLTHNQQVIVFVHSRKETAKTAKYIADKIVENESLAKLIHLSTGAQEILRSETEDASSNGLKAVMPMGFGIHHAGMSRKDRTTVEDLFAQGYLKVLVSTATLAWGVNLPAHTVIIKGTMIYSPADGTWVELSAQDILQMLGRAGRPRYDSNGEGIIITSQNEVKYYLAILNQQLPIESQMASRLADSINAEIVSGRINSLEDCVDWFEYTYLFVRMKHNKALYRVGPGYDDDTFDLQRRRRDLAYSALVILARNGLVKYDYENDIVISTDLGRVASYFYISYQSIKEYDRKLNPYMSEIELFQVFSASEEFKYLHVRDEEKDELKKLMDNAPIPINESPEDSLAKVNVLLQAYISRLSLDGFALMADMIYVVQSAGRLFRAMLELVKRKKWAEVSRLLLDICKMVENRMWLTNSPLRQYPNVPKGLVRTTERSLTPWRQYLALNSEREVIEGMKAQSYGNLAYQLLLKFPKISVSSSVLPITASLMRIQLELVPQWKWDVDIHGYSQSFTVFVEDGDSNNLLFTTSLIVQKKHINEPHFIECTLNFVDRLQHNLFVSVISDSWIGSITRKPIILSGLIMPKRFPAPTPLLDCPLVPVNVFGASALKNLFDFKFFNKFQSQVFGSLYDEEESILFCCSKGNGKTTASMLALLSHWKNGKGRAVYLNPIQPEIDQLYKEWKAKLAKFAVKKSIAKLTNDLSSNLKILASSHLIFATPKQFDVLTRRWKKRKNVQSIELLICDNCHLIGDAREGAIYENVLSRVRFMALNLEKPVRIIAIGSSLASPRDFAEWLGIHKKNIFDFSSRDRVFPLKVTFEKIEVLHNPSAIECMMSPVYKQVQDMDDSIGEQKAVIFVSTRKECVNISTAFIERLASYGNSWLKAEEDSIKKYVGRIKDSSLKASIMYGIGFYYDGMLRLDKLLVEGLFKAGALSCLIATKSTTCWCPSGNLIVVMGTKDYIGRDHCYVDYSVSDLFEMIGLARNTNSEYSRAVVLTNSDEIEYYKKVIGESLPMESNLNKFIIDFLLNEISTGLIKNRQQCVDWITYSYFYRRLQLNPSYYDLGSVSAGSLSEFLSELVENSLKKLSDGKLIELNIDDDLSEDDGDYNDEGDQKVEISPLNGCMIAAYYNISFITMQLFCSSLDGKTRLKKMLEVISSASEFDDITIRGDDDGILNRLYSALPVKWSNGVNFHSPAFKAFILLQAHFSRLNLPPDLRADLKKILSKITDVLYAAIDYLSSEGCLNALNAMDIFQMVIQGLWNSDNSLKQVPFFGTTILDRCKKLNVETVYDIMALEDEERDELLNGLSDRQIESVATFVNQYPNLDVTYKLDLNKPLRVNEEREITLQIDRDEDPEDLTIISSNYPFKGEEKWWIVIGEPESKRLYGIRKLILDKQTQTVKMNFSIAEPGKHDLAIWCVCNAYVDADKQIMIENVKVE